MSVRESIFQKRGCVWEIKPEYSKPMECPRCGASFDKVLMFLGHINVCVSIEVDA